MDKVYVLTIEDTSGATLLVNKMEAYSDYCKAKRQFDLEVKEYMDNNDFTNYNVVKSDNEFVAIHKEEQHNDFIEILLTETNIIK